MGGRFVSAGASGSVLFVSGGERYAVAAAFVQRVERLHAVTRLPGAPAHFAGITSVRGHLLPLIDIGRLFDTAPCSAPAFALILGTGDAALGVVGESAEGPYERIPDAPELRVVDAAALLADPRLTIGALP